ncbi:MAG TPA: relaxase/mobilization nuclease domain-containing protein [Mucilaginibacter sp.]
MIASQKIGKSFMGALNYNLKKLNHPDSNQRAELLDTNFNSLDKEQIRLEVNLVRELRPNLSRYVYHTSLNFSKEDLIENSRIHHNRLQNPLIHNTQLLNKPIENSPIQNSVLLNIAHQYLEAQGFTNNQYFIFRHYDADHPHLHLLVNRISFDGSVVSDSNNYKKSEYILRSIERQYNLVSVAPSIQAYQRAANKDELEMVMRTGKPSEKMLLQEIMKDLLSQKNLTVSELIRKGEQIGVHLLFNQASTGRVTGITYFHNGFKIKGQSLGNAFKWAEIIKKIDYDQVRDSEAISEANGRTKAIYGEIQHDSWAGQREGTGRDHQLYTSDTESVGYFNSQPADIDEIGKEDYPNRERSLEANQDADTLYRDMPDTLYRDTSEINIEIADDEDDEKVYGRGRRRGR